MINISCNGMIHILACTVLTCAMLKMDSSLFASLSMARLASLSTRSWRCFSCVWKRLHSAASFLRSSAQCCMTDCCSSSRALWHRQTDVCVHLCVVWFQTPILYHTFAEYNTLELKMLFMVIIHFILILWFFWLYIVIFFYLTPQLHYIACF